VYACTCVWWQRYYLKNIMKWWIRCYWLHLFAAHHMLMTFILIFQRFYLCHFTVLFTLLYIYLLHHNDIFHHTYNFQLRQSPRSLVEWEKNLCMNAILQNYENYLSWFDCHFVRFSTLFVICLLIDVIEHDFEICFFYGGMIICVFCFMDDLEMHTG